MKKTLLLLAVLSAATLTYAGGDKACTDKAKCDAAAKCCCCCKTCSKECCSKDAKACADKMDKAACAKDAKCSDAKCTNPASTPAGH